MLMLRGLAGMFSIIKPSMLALEANIAILNPNIEHFIKVESGMS